MTAIIRTTLLAIVSIIIGVWLVWPQSVSNTFVGWVAIIIGSLIILLNLLTYRNG